ATSNDAIRSIADASNAALTPHATTNATVTGNNMGGGSIIISLHRSAISNIAFNNNTNIGPIGGIFAAAAEGSTLNVDFLNNAVTVDGNAGANALYVQTANNGGGHSTISAKIRGNTLRETPN